MAPSHDGIGFNSLEHVSRAVRQKSRLLCRKISPWPGRIPTHTELQPFGNPSHDTTSTRRQRNHALAMGEQRQASFTGLSHEPFYGVLHWFPPMAKAGIMSARSKTKSACQNMTIGEPSGRAFYVPNLRRRIRPHVRSVALAMANPIVVIDPAPPVPRPHKTERATVADARRGLRRLSTGDRAPRHRDCHADAKF